MKVAVIGAGLAGLAAGCELADLGHTVTLFERRPWAGGKTYSFTDHETGEQVDNGQHVFMGCTTAYARFLRKLGTHNLTRRQRRLRVEVYNARGQRSVLAAQPWKSPLHLTLSFATYRHISTADKARIARLLLQVQRMHPLAREELRGVLFADWLRGHGQSASAIRDFWDFMLIPTLNCRSDASSAADALFVLQEGFLKSAEACALGIPAVGLSELQVAPAIRYIESRGGSVRLSTTVERVVTEGSRVAGVATAGGQEPFDACVVAVPHTRVAGLLPEAWAIREPFAGLAAIPVSPIINLHMWFDAPLAPFSFAAFVGNELQWVFNRSRLDRRPAAREHLVISLSAAEAYMELDRRELQERFLPQLLRALPGHTGQARLVKFAAIKEPGATFVPAPDLRRPPPTTEIENLVLAGAYTGTGWPATMESAVRSGVAAARDLDVRSPTFAGPIAHGTRRN